MKKMTPPRKLSFVFPLVLSLALCGCQPKAPANPSADGGSAEASSSAVPASSESSSPANETVQTAAAESSEAAVSAPLITIVSHKLEIPGKGDPLLLVTGTYPELILEDSYAGAHNSLNESVKKYNSDSERAGKSGVSDLGIQADEWINMEDGPGSAIFPLFSECKSELRRMDDQVLVIQDTDDLWGGGAHPTTESTYHVWNVNTGEKLGIRSFMNHESGLADAICDELRKDYPDVSEIKEGDPTSYIEGLIKKDELDCAPYGGVLHIHFDQYEIASYASGDFDVELGPDDYGVFLNKSILADKTGDPDLIVSYTDAEPEEMSAGEGRSMFKPACPSWDYYAKSGLKPSDSHVTLKETFKESTDWLNTDSWESRHGFKKPVLPYSDKTWIYEPTHYREYQYMHDALDITNIRTEKTISFDLDTLMDGPDEINSEISELTQFLRYAVCRDDILYVSVGHNTYAESEPRSSYIAAIDINTGEVLWKSDPLVSNALNFIVTDNTIICGYGFTAEDDFIYELDRATGKKVNSIPVKSGPDEFQAKNGILYVATYNTEYEFEMTGE